MGVGEDVAGTCRSISPKVAPGAEVAHMFPARIAGQAQVFVTIRILFSTEVHAVQHLLGLPTMEGEAYPALGQMPALPRHLRQPAYLIIILPGPEEPQYSLCLVAVVGHILLLTPSFYTFQAIGVGYRGLLFRPDTENSTTVVIWGQ